MPLKSIVTVFLLGIIVAASPFAELVPGQYARLPLSTRGRDILDGEGKIFHFMGTNWPGHQEAMIPEGLQHASVEQIVSWIPKLGLNSVRMPFAIEMVDDIFNNSPNQTLEGTLIHALGKTNGSIVLDQILSHNPEFSKNMTRLDVWDAVAKELGNQGILLHLDNHVSKAMWCCAQNDGNGWFGEKHFNVTNWVRGLTFMAKHAKANWPTISSYGLRNELRITTLYSLPNEWYTWYEQMTNAAKAVHQEDPDALIFFSGLDYDTYIDPIPLGKTLYGQNHTRNMGKSAVFKPDDFAFKDKIVLEIHKYDFEFTQDDCETFMNKWYEKGFQALNASDPRTKYLFPMVLSEWGFIRNGTYFKDTTYNDCTIEMVKKWQIGFMQWELSGSFYLQTRPGRRPETIQGLEEFWGLLNYNWSDVRSPITEENSLFKMEAALRW